MTETPISTLARTVVVLSDAQMGMEGEIAVLKAAILALVQSHPEPDAFATRFRQWWLRLGSQHSNPQHVPQTLASIAKAMQDLDEALGRPTGARPPSS